MILCHKSNYCSNIPQYILHVSSNTWTVTKFSWTIIVAAKNVSSNHSKDVRIATDRICKNTALIVWIRLKKIPHVMRQMQKKLFYYYCSNHIEFKKLKYNCNAILMFWYVTQNISDRSPSAQGPDLLSAVQELELRCKELKEENIILVRKWDFVY